MCKRANVLHTLPDDLHDPAVDSKQFRQDLKTYLLADIRNVSALKVLHERVLQIDIYLLTYLLYADIYIYMWV